MTGPVQAHYGAADIVERILAAVPWSRDAGAALAASQLFPFDQLHGRELHATRDHAGRLAPRAGDRLLDVGSGVGGPARYFASTFGCRVCGVDLTPEFVAAARELTALCGLAELIEFHEADAGAVPLADAGFDHAYSFYVGMNLPDKPAVLSEVHRLLRPGGRLIWTEVTSASGSARYPLPWARTAETSHVGARDHLVGQVEAAGFAVVAVEDETAAHMELAQEMRRAGRVPSQGHKLANAVVMGSDFAERRANYIASLSEGGLASTLIEARKPAV